MVNLADQDTSFLVPCRHCGDLLPEQDRICPHCGKDQTVAPAKASAGTDSPASSGPATDDDAPDPFAAARGPSDFTSAGLGPHAADDGAARRRRQAIGVVALIAGVLLLGMAWDRYADQRATTTAPSSPAIAQEPTSTVPASRPVPAAEPVVRPPAAASPTPTAPPPAAALAAAPPSPGSGANVSATSPATPATTDDPASPCNEALAAMSLCARP